MDRTNSPTYALENKQEVAELDAEERSALPSTKAELMEELATFELEEFRSLLPRMHEMHHPPPRSVQENEAFEYEIVEMLELIVGVYGQWVKKHEREKLSEKERRMHDEMVQFFYQYGFKDQPVDF